MTLSPRARAIAGASGAAFLAICAAIVFLIFGPGIASQADPASGLVWKAGDPAIGKWIVANTFQCEETPLAYGAIFTFTMNFRSDGSCGRNQANPVTSSGSLVMLTTGRTYMWTFHYIDGKLDGSGPGMGPDRDARSLIWQIHGLNEAGTPCTTLNFGNAPSGAQQWQFRTCAGTVWTGGYTPGESDDFKIVVTVSLSDADGMAQLYRNGVLQVTDRHATFHNATAAWWNFGPYKWRWERGVGGSSMTQVNATISNMQLTLQ